MLTAHPDALVSHELDALHYVRWGVTQDQLFSLIRARDNWFHARKGQWTEYKYAVPGASQGRVRTLRVIGDKKGGMTSTRLIEHPDLLDRLERTLDVPVRYVHQTRNPFDNIATMARRANTTAAQQVDPYFALVAAAERAREQAPAERWFDTTHEDLIRDPRGFLEGLAEFLGLSCDPTWVDACEAVVFESPRRSRDQADWSPEVVEDIMRRASVVPALAHYRPELG